MDNDYGINNNVLYEIIYMFWREPGVTLAIICTQNYGDHVVNNSYATAHNLNNNNYWIVSEWKLLAALAAHLVEDELIPLLMMVIMNAVFFSRWTWLQLKG